MMGVIPIVSVDSLWLMGGGLLGAVTRALWTRGQKNLGLETLHDAFIGLLIGALWTIEMPGLAAIWPPFEFSANASQLQRALLVSLFVSVTIEGFKQILIRWGRGYLTKLGGQTPEDTKTPNA